VYHTIMKCGGAKYGVGQRLLRTVSALTAYYRVMKYGSSRHAVGRRLLPTVLALTAQIVWFGASIHAIIHGLGHAEQTACCGCAQCGHHVRQAGTPNAEFRQADLGAKDCPLCQLSARPPTVVARVALVYGELVVGGRKLPTPRQHICSAIWVLPHGQGPPSSVA